MYVLIAWRCLSNAHDKPRQSVFSPRYETYQTVSSTHSPTHRNMYEYCIHFVFSLKNGVRQTVWHHSKPEAVTLQTRRQERVRLHLGQ